MTKPLVANPTLSVRLIWPVARALQGNPIGDELLVKMGLTAEQFVDPETRVATQVAFALLDELAARIKDPLIGLRAGELVDFADFDILEHAARSTPNLEQAQETMWRYMDLMHDVARFWSERQGDLLLSHYGWAQGVVASPCVNDFTVACALAFSRRNMLEYTPPREIRMQHARPEYAAEYEKFFGCPVTFGAPDNVIVASVERMHRPMRAASPVLAAAFEAQAQRLLEKMHGRQTLAGRVHADIAAHLGGEEANMEKTAKRLAMGVATLRRKLEDEGITYSEILDDLRRDLAERYLKEKSTAVSEVAFLLGFSDVRAFSRAFKRWTNVSPSDYRTGQR
jgi:AraC-like DNA-binding protein